jgi:hypothetical protein
VGWLVAVAMMKFSGGVGGRRYQIAAALLTYAAVSMAAIPIGLYEVYNNRPKQTEQQKLAAEQQQLEKESDSGSQEPARAPVRVRPSVSLGLFLGRLAMLGLASPFYQLRDDPFWGVMGLLILFFGMRVAWKIAAGRSIEINGPFESSPPLRT